MSDTQETTPPPVLFTNGTRFAFQFGNSALIGSVVASTGENLLIRYRFGLLLLSRADLLRRLPVILPARRTFWERVRGCMTKDAAVSK